MDGPQTRTGPYLAANPLPLKDELLKYNTRGREWKFAELIDEVKELPHGRSFEVSKQLFKVANCVACHKINGEGQVFGPDLTKLDKKKQSAEYILQSILEPSKEISPQFTTWIIETIAGKTHTGFILEDNRTGQIKLGTAAGEVIVINEDEVETREPSKISVMPEKLHEQMTPQELRDLLGFLETLK